MSSDRNLTLIVGDGEWSALYVDGELDTYGDHYLSDERIRELAGVTVEHSNDFHRTLAGVEFIAQDLEEFARWQQEAQQKMEKISALRAEATRLRVEADRIEKELPL